MDFFYSVSICVSESDCKGGDGGEEEGREGECDEAVGVGESGI
jgi:hypothetical protein